LTFSPHCFKSRPSDAAQMPLPSPDTTPPVTKMYFINFLPPQSKKNETDPTTMIAAQRQRSRKASPAAFAAEPAQTGQASQSFVPRTARNKFQSFFGTSPSRHLRFSRLFGVKIVPLPRNQLASSATGGASPISMCVPKNSLRGANVRASGACAERSVTPTQKGRSKERPF